MPKLMVTWLGEDDQHSEVLYDKDGNESGRRPAPGPSFTYWGDVRFDKDKAVLIDNEAAGLTPEQKLQLDNIVMRAPRMTKRFKVGPVAEKQPERQSKG